MSGCRALSLVPSTCPRPDRLWDEGLDYQSLPVPDKTFPANQDSPAVPARSLCFRRLGTCWERRPYPRTLPHPPGRGILLQPPSSCLCPSSRGGPGHQQFQAGSAVCCPIGQWQHGQCPLPTEWWRGGQAGSSWSPRKEEGEGASCSWTT